MPILKQCSICNALVEYGTKCKCEIDRERKRYKEYAMYRQDKDEQSIYSSDRWSKVKELVHRGQYGIDIVEYYKTGKIIPIEVCHHIVEIKEDISKAYNVTNIIGLTQSNHMVVHSKYNKSNKDKKEIQELLFRLLEKWSDEFR